MKNRNVLVTGGAGFVGSCLVKKLLSSGSNIVVYDNFFTGKIDNLPKDYKDKLTIVRGDICDKKKVLDTLERFQPSVLFHLAALHYIPYCNSHPLETLRVNIEGTQVIIEGCRKLRKVKRIIFISSAALYPVVDHALQENDFISPNDVYGLSKFSGEKLIEILNDSIDIPCIIARLFNVYGPNETNPHVIPHIVDQLRNKDTLELGNLNSKRDYIYVSDVADALIALSEYDTTFDIFNIGTGKEYSVQDIVDICGKILHRNLRVASKESFQRKIDREHLLSSISKIESATGWIPRFDLESGLKELLRFEGILN